jgi:serine/threonine protein kinase
MDFAARQQFGKWVLQKRLGRGGNSQVWQAVCGENEVAAIKLPTKQSYVPYSRFRSEVQFMEERTGADGILPVLDSYLPEEWAEGDQPWFAMPVAVQLAQVLKAKDSNFVLSSILEVAKVLESLHSEGATHRDIKPENLLWYDKKVVLGDFGLVAYPNKEEVTANHISVGAKNTIAPEMRSVNRESDSKPADVYSLAKTLWMLACNQSVCFDGQYHGNSTVGLAAMGCDLASKSLDELLSSATDNVPANRPTMSRFCEQLQDIIETRSDLSRLSWSLWDEVSWRLFPQAVPDRAKWTRSEEIVRALSAISESRAYNHLFFPDGGGLDLRGAALGAEPNTIELYFDTPNSAYVIRPKALYFESFSASDWNYLRLEFAGLERSGVYGDTWDRNSPAEEVVELPGGRYVDRYAWDEREFEGDPLPSDARLLIRYGYGSMVVFHTRSIYNLTSSTYDGRHNKMGADKFRSYIEDTIKYCIENAG